MDSSFPPGPFGAPFHFCIEIQLMVSAFACAAFPPPQVLLDLLDQIMYDPFWSEQCLRFAKSSG